MHSLVCQVDVVSAVSQGDYERQLHKMGIAAQRKHAVLLKMLDFTSRHLLLLLLGGQEGSRLGWLLQQLTAAHAQLKGNVERVCARVSRCVLSDTRSRVLCCFVMCELLSGADAWCVSHIRQANVWQTAVGYLGLASGVCQ
jgi:hypothetical protein